MDIYTGLRSMAKNNISVLPFWQAWWYQNVLHRTGEKCADS